MSAAFKKRKKAIRDEKKRIGYANLERGNSIPRDAFLRLQQNWRRAIDGPPLCSLADLLG